MNEKNIAIAIPSELNSEIEMAIGEEPKYASKSDFIETAIRLFLQRIKENENML